MKFGIFERWPWFNRTMEARSKTLHRREAKSMAAELNVLEAAKALPGVVSVHHAIRIPNPQMSLGSGEVDVVVVTNRACLLMECKNFLGKINLEDGDIVQYKNGSKPRKDTKEILPVIRRKAQDLQRWASSLYSNAALEVVPLVVLSNPQAELDQAVKDHPNIATLKNLGTKVAHLLKNHPLVEPEEIKSVEDMMAMFGTWDSVSADGGLTLNGDLIDADLPEGWSRNELASIEVDIVGGKWKTLLRGPKIAVTLHRRDGSTEKMITRPNLSIRHSQPWGKSGVDGKGLYPIEHFSTISFGHDNEVVMDEKGFRVQSFAGKHLEKLPSIGEKKATHRKNNHKVMAEQFPVGTITNGAVHKHLKEDNGSVYGILVSLVERELHCLLPSRVIRGINPDLFDVFYGVGTVIEIRITENRGPGKIFAELY